MVQERDGANNLKAQLVRDGNIGGFWSRERITARRWVLIGKDGRIQWIDKQINPHTHGADVLARFKREN